MYIYICIYMRVPGTVLPSHIVFATKDRENCQYHIAIVPHFQLRRGWGAGC